MPKITALIPARGGSKGIPRKNIKLLNGHPLIAYSIIACQLSKNIGRIIVSTEDKEIASISINYGAEVPFMRPEEYAGDDSTDQDVLRHFFMQIDDEEVTLIRPTTPLRNPSLLDSYIEKYYHDKEAATAFRSMHEMPESPYKLCKVEEGYCTGFFDDYKGITNYNNLPRQIFPKTYQPNGYIDIIKRSTVFNGTAFGLKVKPFITEHVTEVDVQYQFDFLEKEITEENILLRALNNG